MKKRVISALLSAVLVINAVVSQSGQWEAFATDSNTIVYNVNSMDTYKNRTPESVAAEYSKAINAGESYVDGDRSTYYSVAASTANPYHQGVLSDDTLAVMEGMTNFYRWLVGAEKLLAPCEQLESLQYQALDRNFQFGHDISNDSKPEDMSDEMWQKGFECKHNILAWGYTPKGAIRGWINEGYSLSAKEWGTLGHRRALIGRYVSEVQFGFSGSIGVGVNVAYDNSGYKEAVSCFPAAGYMPSELVSPYECAWEASINGNMISVPDTDAVTVEITNLTSGKTITRSSSDNTVMASGSSILFAQPDDFEGYEYTDSYSVVIEGLEDAETGKEAQICYSVNFYDAAELADTHVQEVAECDSTYVIYETLNDTESLEKIASILPDTVTAVGESGKEATVPVNGKWVLDKENSCFTNSADASQLPSNITDKNNVLENISIKYIISDDSYDRYNRLTINPSDPQYGDSGTMSVYRTLVSTDASRIFRITEDNGSYTSEIMFDSQTSPEFDPEASKASTYSASHIYNVDCFTSDYNGEYISTYFYSDRNSEIYVSTSIKSINIQDENGIVGDINSDGKCNVADVSLLMKYIVKISELNSGQLKIADVNSDGIVNVFDVIILKNIVMD